MSFISSKDKIKPKFKALLSLKKAHEDAANNTRNIWDRKLEVEAKIVSFDTSVKESLTNQPEKARLFALGELTAEQYASECPDGEQMKAKYQGFQVMVKALLKEHKKLRSIEDDALIAYRALLQEAWTTVAENEILDITPALLRAFGAYQTAMFESGNQPIYEDFLHRLLVPSFKRYEHEIGQLREQLKVQHLVRS